MVNKRVASRAAERLKILDQPHGIFAAGGASVPTQEKKDLRKLEHFTEFHEMLRTDEKVLSRPSKKQILTVLPKGCKKSAVKKNSVEKPLLDLSTIFPQKL